MKKNLVTAKTTGKPDLRRWSGTRKNQFWSKIDGIMGKYDVKHIHSYSREPGEDDKETYKECWVTNNMIEAMKDLNFSPDLVYKFTQDFKDVFNEKEKIEVTYGIKDRLSEQELLSYYLKSEYDPSGEDKVPLFTIKYEVKKEILKDNDQREILTDEYLLTYNHSLSSAC